MIWCFKGSKILLFWLLLASLSRACIKTSTYYRSQYRSQTHVFVPEEFRPIRPERSLEASGPLEPQDFQTSIPTSRLVRLDGPNIQFASEESRWMTKGCRDKLQKLSSLVQNTWPNNDVGLRILDGWIKPPPTLLRQSKVVTKRDYTGKHKQPLQMSVPEDLVDFETPSKPQPVSRYRSGTNGLGIKVANPESHVIMLRPRPKQINRTDVPRASHVPRAYPVYRDHQWGSSQDLSVVGFGKWHLQQKQHPAMMEEFHYAGRAVDMILVDTKTGGSSRLSSVYPGKLAQLAYYGALFDWCYFARQGHVHCSVKPDSIITSQWFGCFPGSAQAMSPARIPIPLSSLQIGDNVMTLDPQTHKLYSTKIGAFLHRDEHQYSQWIEITFQRADASIPLKLRLTANHLIYCWRGGKTAIFASQVQPGDEIACNLDHPEVLCQVEATRVVNSSLTETGVYAPLTTTGDMIVNGVYVSCFAHIQNDRLAYLTTLPLNYIPSSSGLNLREIQTGVHYYAEFLLKIAQFFMPDQLFLSRI